ncbi:MAG: DUF3160 domain-containing protein [Planctomycetes bacterium]|nr:DUF3160 domain-containing protein [Planctomycetota bacterium]
MFSDQEWAENKNKNVNLAVEKKQLTTPKNKLIFWLVISLLAVITGFGAVLSLKSGIWVKPKPQPIAAEPTGKNDMATATAFGKLPEGAQQSGNDIGPETGSGDIKAEELAFGAFYEKPVYNLTSQRSGYDLPINIKTDVLNYYEVTRKFNLDPYLDELNNNGFALGKNIFSQEANDFFSLYRYLYSRDIPIIVTNDFLLYYYQNTLKHIYKEIEKNVFYDNLWEFNKKMYEIALSRYRQHYEETGLSNDPVLESKRLELAYLAVTLSLLRPTEAQINRRENFIDERKFTLQEAENFSIDLPLFLSDDAKREEILIREASQVKKSPVFLYTRDYRQFAVPDNYRPNAKLNNFFLALKWLNTHFPLYYQDEACPDCLLDENDWLINLAAACYLADDLSKNQELKNQWAIIYKFISYFSGLRRDLTFLDYAGAMSQIFGNNYNLDEIFSTENPDRQRQVLELRNMIADENFLAMEGGLPRDNPDELRHIGVRLLQENYWPDDYIFSALTGREMEYNGAQVKKTANITYCADEKGKFIHRCRGFGLDIINILHPVDPAIDNFLVNTSYLFYQDRQLELRSQLDKFDVFTWNNNLYWSIMDINRLLLKKNTESYPPGYARNEFWQKTKMVNTALGSWVTARQTEDSWVNYVEDKNDNLGIFAECNAYNFIEPDFDFSQELIAKNNMLIKMLTVLKVVDKTNAASIQLKEFNKKLSTIANIISKELDNGNLDAEDCRFITDLVGHYEIERKAENTVEIKFSGNRTMVESLKGVKILMVVNEYHGKKMLVLGPVFNYEEYLKL